jgi:hypothetical protein
MVGPHQRDASRALRALIRNLGQVTTGNNVIIPGPGKDQVITGDGDDIVVINDECEIVAGERISTGAGHDVVISPVDRAGLVARGVILGDVEEVRVERHSCQSECRNPPQCSGTRPRRACEQQGSNDRRLEVTFTATARHPAR